jgi:hypothetical protein
MPAAQSLPPGGSPLPSWSPFDQGLTKKKRCFPPVQESRKIKENAVLITASSRPGPSRNLENSLGSMLHLLPDLLRTLWALVLRECPGRTLLSRASSARAAVADHLWLVAAVLLRPILGGPGPFERRCFSRALRLDPPSHRVEVRELATATVNGGKDVLRATLWLPSGVKGPLPTVIIRNPYGSPYRTDWGQVLLAERGYAVLLQDTRGRFGSDGDFVPVEHEREDGLATVRWAREQPWCSGRVGVFGVSYLGLTACGLCWSSRAAPSLWSWSCCG